MTLPIGVVDEHSITIDEEPEPLRLVSAWEHKLRSHVMQIVLDGNDAEVTQVLCVVAVEQRQVTMLDDVLGVVGKLLKVEVCVAEDGAATVMDVHDGSIAKQSLSIIGSASKDA